MKWILVSKSNALIQEIHLMVDQTSKVVIKYNPLHRSARLSCDNQHRLFFIELTDSLAGKYVFRNEYGMEVGNLRQDRWLGKDGSVMIESQRYAFKITNSPLAGISIFENSSGNPSVSCSPATSIVNTGAPYIKQDTKSINNCLLLGLCWYLCLPKVKESLMEFAA